MKPLKNNVIYRKDTTYASQKSSILHTIEPEVAWIVEYIGSKVEHVKAGDRIIISGSPRAISDKDMKSQLFMISEDNILGVYGGK
jgi:hypothetical protein